MNFKSMHPTIEIIPNAIPINLNSKDDIPLLNSKTIITIETNGLRSKCDHKHLNTENEWNDAIEKFMSSDTFKYIELICKKYNGSMDLMFAYDDPSNRSNGTLFIGHWNSGTVK